VRLLNEGNKNSASPKPNMAEINASNHDSEIN